MSTSEVNTPTPNEGSRQRVAAEVLELGQTLFELALEYTQGLDGGEGDRNKPGEDGVIHELRSAKDAFFIALGLLFGLEQA